MIRYIRITYGLQAAYDQRVHVTEELGVLTQYPPLAVPHQGPEEEDALVFLICVPCVGVQTRLRTPRLGLPTSHDQKAAKHGSLKLTYIILWCFRHCQRLIFIFTIVLPGASRFRVKLSHSNATQVSP